MAIDKSDYKRVFSMVFSHVEELLLSLKPNYGALTQYFETWQEIAEKAAELDNLALQEVILLFIDACSSAFKKTPDVGNLTNAQWQLLKKWDDLFASYIDAPDDQQIALALIKCLNDPLLDMGLDSADEQMLLEGFLPVINQLTSNSKQDFVEDVPIAKQISIWEKLAISFKEADLNLQETLVGEINVADEIYAEKVKHYLESWRVIANLIETENDRAITKILDVVLLFIEFSCQLFNQSENLSHDQQQLLKQWHNLFAHYITVHGSQQLGVVLIACLKNPAWLQPISSEDETMLLAELTEVDTPTALLCDDNSVFVTTIATASNEEALNSPHAEEEIAASFTPALQTQEKSDVSNSSINFEAEAEIAAEQPSLEFLYAKTTLNLTAVVENQLQHDETALKLSLQCYLESWLAIAKQIEIAGERQGLLDVVLLFIEVSRQTFKQLKSFDEKKIALLTEWQSLFAGYLETDANQEHAAALIKCLSDPLWSGAIMPEDEEMLLAGFTATPELPSEFAHELSSEAFAAVEQTAVIAEAGDEAESAQEFIREAEPASFIAEATESTIEFMGEVEEPVSFIAEAVEMGLAEETELELNLIDAEEPLDFIEEVVADEVDEASAGEQSGNTSSWQEIEPVFNQAVAFLKTTVDSAIVDDTAASKQGLQDYIECWQAISEIVASDDNQLALADVVLLFAETCKQTFTDLDHLNSEQLELLTHWQTNFAGYFSAPHNPQFGLKLVKCLRDPLWSAPIEAEDELMLLEALGIEDSLQIPLETAPDSSADVAVVAQKNPIWQKIEVFFDDAQSRIEVMQDLLTADNQQTCHDYLQQYAQSWLVIGEIIAEEDEEFQTLTDLTLLFADNCMELVEKNSLITQDIIQLLSTWGNAFIAYLQDIKAALQASTLIACLENSHWLQPLTAMDRGMLLEMMDEDTQQQSMFDDESENPFMFDSDGDDFALFAEELDSGESPFQMTDQTSATEESEQVALFADESLPADAEEEFVLLVEESEPDEVEFLTAVAENESAEAVLFADESLLDDAEEEFALLVEESEYTPEESLTFADEAETIVADSTPEPADFAETTEVVKELPPKQGIVVNPELIGMVRDEFALLAKDLNAEIETATDPQAFKIVLKNHEFKFENLAKACNTIGLLGLEQVFEQLSLNMHSRRDSDSFTETEAELFKAALPLIQNYVAGITERNNSIFLVAHLSMPGWKQPLSEAQTKSLLALLSGLVLSSRRQQQDNRKTVAELADVSLVLPDDVNSELLDSLLNELPVLTGNFSAVIQKIISGSGNVAQLLEAQRIAHTLKGSGNIVGVAGIAVVTHHLEEILEYLTEHKVFPTKALAEVLLESADCLEMMGDLMLNGEREPPEQALQVLQNVLNWANQIANNGLPSEDSQIETTTLPAQPDTDITPIVHEAKAAESVAMTRVPSDVIDELLRMTGEGSILSEQFKERIKRFSQELKALNELTWHMQSLVSELDQSINIQSYSAKASRAGADDEFDALEMEQYNELHTAASRISEVATDIREINIHMDEQLVDLKYLMIEEDTIQKENQEIVQSIRMVPASTIASRCHRIVRQACRATNKEVDLDIKGADILIDSEILNDMVEPLMHLLRNSIDHGIEPVSIRERNNKPKTGKITLEFSRKGNYAVISCKDDGAGLASGNILQTAIKKGLISAKQQLTDAEIHKLILIPGFSTRAVATQTSGRGIGMDAIQTKISTIQGQMNLSSVRGEGLTIEITIPLTLSSMLSLLIKCGGQTMAISNRGLRKIHHSDECTVIQENEQLYCDIDYQRYPAKYFAELVGMPFTYNAMQKLPALRIEDEIGRTHVVFVEELLGYRDLLVKNIGSYIPHIQGITGASILGNGDVAPVIDLVEMLHNSAKYDYVLADATKALADSINGLPMALVIDDSLSARRAVASLLKDSGLEVETAIDGLDAIKHIEKAIPDIIVVDLEMPRMNGIEFTAHVRGREAMKNTPVIMITSRATEKHRKQAEAAGVTKFMTKPFTEDELVNSVRMLMK